MNKLIMLYKTSHEHDLIKFNISIEELAGIIVNHNYGTHKMIRALIEEYERKYPNSELAADLKDVIDKHTLFSIPIR